MFKFLKPADIHPKNALLIDSIGAMASFVFLFVLSVFHSHIGLTEQVLKFLSLTALAFAVFSFSNHL